MKKCLAYRALGLSRNRWVRCGFAAVSGSDYCKKHGDAVIGGVLGVWAAGLLEADVSRHFKVRGKISGESQGSRRGKLPANGSHA